MKKLNIYFLALVAMVAASCSSDDDAFETGGEGTKMTLVASVEDNSDGTRSTLEKDGNIAHFKWAKGDKISVFSMYGRNIEFTLDDASDGQGDGTFSGTIPDGETIGTYAYYPHNTQSTGETQRFLPYGFTDNYYEYTPNTNAPLHGTINGDAISFKYLTGIVKVTLKNVPEGATEFKFTAPGKNISGIFNIETSGEDKVINVTNGNDYSHVAYSFDPLTAAKDMEFYIPLPVGTYENGFKIEVFDNTFTNVLFAKETTSAKTIKRATVMAMAELDAGLDYELNGTTFTVYTAAGLQAVNKIITDDLATYVSHNITLANDITLTGENNWTAIGDGETTLYTGTFDGNGKSITGLHIDTTKDTQALISSLGEGGTVKNLTLIGCHVANKGTAAAIVGCNYAGTIEGCTVKSIWGYDVYICGDVFVGGIVGYNCGTVINCIVDENGSNFEIKCTGTSFARTGGISGANDGYIIACLTRYIELTGKDDIGGIAGDIGGATIIGCCSWHCKGNGEFLYDSKNIYGTISISGNTITQCYYTTNDGYSFGHVGGDAYTTGWSPVANAMNGALASYGVEWVADDETGNNARPQAITPAQ